ncbi:hypothetical protein K502DRAFT_325253 [Neoconidiobolus thromboides FSU 785]|nr:hypothetical protein K502DRAFT_325253 [Neoconidiobolus thromboides FSU 785]
MSGKIIHLFRTIKRAVFSSKYLRPVNDNHFYGRVLVTDASQQTDTREGENYMSQLKLLQPSQHKLFEKNLFHLKLLLPINYSLKFKREPSYFVKQINIKSKDKQVVINKENLQQKKKSAYVKNFRALGSYLKSVKRLNKTLLVKKSDFIQDKNIVLKGTFINLFKIREHILSFKLTELNPSMSHYYLSYPLQSIHFHYFLTYFGKDTFMFNSSPNTCHISADKETQKSLLSLSTIFPSSSIQCVLILMSTLIKFGSWKIQLFKDQVKIWFPTPFNMDSIKLFLKHIGLAKYQHQFKLGQLPYSQIHTQRNSNNHNNQHYQNNLLEFIYFIDQTYPSFGSNKYMFM